MAQKIEALAGRAVTQARDVFDLGLLIQGGYFADASGRGALAKSAFPAAIDNLSALTWDDYNGQVVEFLSPESREQFGTRAAWDTLQTSVYELLQAHA